MYSIWPEFDVRCFLESDIHANNGWWNDVIRYRTENWQRPPYEDLERVPSDLSCGLKGKSHLWQDFVSRVLYLPSSSSCYLSTPRQQRRDAFESDGKVDIPTIEDLVVSGNN